MDEDDCDIPLYKILLGNPYQKQLKEDEPCKKIVNLLTNAQLYHKADKRMQQFVSRFRIVDGVLYRVNSLQGKNRC